MVGFGSKLKNADVEICNDVTVTARGLNTHVQLTDNCVELRKKPSCVVSAFQSAIRHKRIGHAGLGGDGDFLSAWCQ